MTDQVRAAAGGNPAEFQGIALLFRSSKGEVKLGSLSLGVDRESFANLRAMLGQLTNVTEWEIEGDPNLLDERLEADFIIREGAPAETIVARLQVILEFKLPVTLTFRKVEGRVFVARGAFRFTPIIGRGDCVEIYGQGLSDKDEGGIHSNDFPEFLKKVADFIGCLVVSEVEKPPEGKIRYHYNDQGSSELCLPRNPRKHRIRKYQ